MSETVVTNLPATPAIRPRPRAVASRAAAAPVDSFSPGQTSDLVLMPRPGSPGATPPREINREQARGRLGGDNRPAQTVQIGVGQPGRAGVFTIHGMNGSPADLQPIAQTAQREGKEVHTLVYDDQFRRLTDTSQELAQQLGEWLERNPGRPLHLSAHSMGSRIALGALEQLNRQGRLSGRPIQLDLLAPPLGGFASADLARLDFTGALSSMIPGIRPGYDMGSTSAFQERLESLRLPPNVSTRIFLGGRDRLIDPNTSGFQRIAANLNAEVIHLPEAGHGNLPAHVAPDSYRQPRR